MKNRRLVHTNTMSDYGFYYNCDIVGVNLTNFEFYECRFSDVNFINCIFDNTSFYNCIFQDNTKCRISFKNCTFNGKQPLIMKGVDGNNPPYSVYRRTRVTPAKGAFIGWKRVIVLNKDTDPDKYISSTYPRGIYPRGIVKLLIPEDAKRSNSRINKCRASKAYILEIQDLKGNVLTDHVGYSIYSFNKGKYFKYEPVSLILPQKFDEKRTVECGAGIHFFITRKEAVDYLF